MLKRQTGDISSLPSRYCYSVFGLESDRNAETSAVSAAVDEFFRILRAVVKHDSLSAAKLQGLRKLDFVAHRFKRLHKRGIGAVVLCVERFAFLIVEA